MYYSSHAARFMKIVPTKNKDGDLTGTVVRGIEDYFGDIVFNTISCDSQFVSDALKDKIPKWTTNTPVLIEAPTGSGKSTFIFEEVVPYAKHLLGNVIVLSNRVAISRQQKQIMMEKNQDSRLERLTEAGLQEELFFDNVAIMTYHRLQSFLSDRKNLIWVRDVKFVVADEAHFFSADSQINVYTSLTLDMITRRLRHAVRIYLTATVWDVSSLLYLAEERARRDSHRALQDFTGEFADTYLSFIRYQFPVDYSRYQLDFISDLKDILPEIVRSKKKWMIFCSSKTVGLEFKGTLAENQVDASYIDATCKSGPVWDELVKESRFSSKVLVSTSVLDCGVNVKDPDVKNIVVCADNRTAMLQMIGRKRLAPGETLHVYALDIGNQTLGYRKKNLLPKLQAIRDFKKMSPDERQKYMSALWRDPSPEIMSLFAVRDGELYYNGATEFYIEKSLALYDKILSGETSFKNEVRCWLGLPPEPKPQYRFETIKDFYEATQNATFGESELNEFRQLIKRHWREANMPTEPQPKRDLGVRALNKRLEELDLPYRLDKAGDEYCISRLPDEPSGHGAN